MSTDELAFWDAVDTIRSGDGRYRREAYGFVMAALGAAARALPDERRRDPERRHLSGQELLRSVVALAGLEFGSFGPVVFREWGVQSGEDVGRIVFQLVESGQLSARPEDSIEDFRRGSDLLAALAGEPGARRGPEPDARPGRPGRADPGASGGA